MLKQHVWGRGYIDELVQIAINDDPTDAGEDDCETVYYALHDANYNVIGIVDSVGVLTERYQYTPYGQRTVFISAGDDDPACLSPTSMSQRVTVSSVAQPYGICDIGHQGLMHDEEIGLIYNRARTLHPRLGRFMQRDPLGYIGGMNLYEYTNSNPISYCDPSGLLSLKKTARLAIAHRPAGIHEKYSPGLMLCLLWKESSFNESATNSGSSAKGIAQILAGTADDIQDRVGPRRFGISADPFYILKKGERLRDHRFNPHVSIYAAYLYLEDRRIAKGGDWESGVYAYGLNGNKVIECSKCCGIIKFDKEGNLKNPDEVWKCLKKIHK